MRSEKVRIEEIGGKRVALLLSGGVDSAVAACMLVEQGIRPDCYYIRISPDLDGGISDGSGEWGCSEEEDMEMASQVAGKYGLRMEVVDCKREYLERVTRYTMEKVRQGLTPNPDVMCNRWIKFGAFDEKVGKEYDYIATGHYAQTEVDDQGLKWLVRSKDAVKDQTDFLAQIEGWQLGKALFPIGHMSKEEVREVARRERLACAERKDSQGICFLGKINYNDYVRRYLGEKVGDVVELETGRKIGEHRGLWFHTIGQRHGLGFGGGPWFAVRKDMESNTLYVSHGYSPEAAYRSEFGLRDFHFLTAEVAMDRVMIKIRHTAMLAEARILSEELKTKSEKLRVRSGEKIHGVAPGQFCVVYDEAGRRCIGSGEIT